jgi:hypothetical protein
VTEVTELIRDAYHVLAADGASLAVIAVACAAAAYAMKGHLAHPSLTILVFAGMVLLALAADYALILTGVFGPPRPERWLLWTMVAATCGVIGTIVALGGTAALRRGRSREPQRGRR